MPRKLSVHKDSVFAVLCSSKDAIVQNGKIATPRDAIWTKLTQQLEGKMSPKALYTFVKLNRHNIWSALGICDHEMNVDMKFDLSCIIPGQTDYQVFQLEIPFEDWVQFIPVKVEQTDNFLPCRASEHTVLNPDTWTHIINDLICKKIKNVCTVVFQRAIVSSTITSNYMEITGYCEECYGNFEIICDRQPAINNPMLLQCYMINTDASLHTRRSKRSRSKNVKELHEGRMEPEGLMDVGDPEPSHLPNVVTLQKIKQEREDFEFGDNDPIASLQSFKYSAPHSGSIRDIGLDMFFCHYWTQTQLHMYNTLCNKSPPTLCFGATGSVVRELVRPNGTSGNIILYQGVLMVQNCSSVPVVQMLSEKHDVYAVANWLTEWICAGAVVPKETVSDFSLALLGGLVKAFTPYPDLKTYINECFHVCLGIQSAKLPPCFVRVDVAHCIKMIWQWDCLKNKTHCVKEFFVRSIAQLLQSQSLDQVKQLLHAVTVVALSKTEGHDDSGAPLASERCKKYLKAQIAEDPIIIPDEETKEVDPCEEIQTDLRQWVTDICEESRSLAAANGDRENTHFLPEIIPYIIRLTSYLPLWTGLMVPVFNSSSITASSLTVQEEFKNIKQELSKYENLPVQVDHFITRHLSFIQENMQVCSAKVKNKEDATVAMTPHGAEVKIKVESEEDFPPLFLC